jgi:hypothetical protein
VSWIATDPGTPRTAYALAGVFGDASSFDEVARTSDGGVTWSDPKPVVPPAPGVANILGQLFVLGDHSVVDVFAQCDNTLSCRGGDAVVKAVFSTDGAAAWSPLPEAGVSIPADGAFDAATDRNGDLLVAFPGPAGAGWAIRTSRSTDRGRTWSEPITAVETTLRPTHVTLAVAGDGTLGLTYADHGSPGLDGAAPYEVWFASSRAGSPWQRTRLAGPTDFASAPAADLHAGDAEAMGIGEWQGLVGVPHGFAAAFALGTPQATIGPTDIFFARR